MNYKNKSVPPKEIIDALHLGVHRHGVAGLVERLKMSWSIVMTAAFGHPISSDKLETLYTRLLDTEFLPKNYRPTCAELLGENS